MGSKHTTHWFYVETSYPSNTEAAGQSWTFPLWSQPTMNWSKVQLLKDSKEHITFFSGCVQINTLCLHGQAQLWPSISSALRDDKTQPGLQERQDTRRAKTALTTCMAEPLGGWGSMRSWEGVCPKLRIWASTAWKKQRQVRRLRGVNYRPENSNCHLQMSCHTSGLFHICKPTSCLHHGAKALARVPRMRSPALNAVDIVF